jgi:hypothetical protein
VTLHSPVAVEAMRRPQAQLALLHLAAAVAAALMGLDQQEQI